MTRCSSQVSTSTTPFAPKPAAAPAVLGAAGHGQQWAFPAAHHEHVDPTAESEHKLGEDGHGQYHGGERIPVPNPALLDALLVRGAPIASYKPPAPAHKLGEDGHGQYHGGEAPHLLGQDGHGQYHGGEIAEQDAALKGRARRLKEMGERLVASQVAAYVAEEEEEPEVVCARVEEIVAKAAPAALMFWALLEFSLFYAAMVLASRAKMLVDTARRMGANAM